MQPNYDNPQMESKPIGTDTVYSLIENCPRLTGLGNLRTWRHIDYYNPSDPNYYKLEESCLGKLKQEVKQSNWDLDLDLENLDHIYNKQN